MGQESENGESKRQFTDGFLCSAEMLSKFEPTSRDSDIYTATIPKCGQTWITTLLYHLKTRCKYPDMEGQDLMGVVPWLENPINLTDEEGPFVPYDIDERIQEYERQVDPRVFKMHVTWENIPRAPDSKTKVITVTRDPRDLPYSYYKHVSAMNDHPAVPKYESFEQYFEDYMKDFFISKWMKSFWPHRNDPNLLWIRYEDMKQNLKAVAHQIIEFTGWDITDEVLEKAVDMCSLQNMQKSEKTVIFARRTKVFRRDSSFIREGKVGVNRTHLTEDMENRLIERLRSELPEDAFKFLLPDL